VRPVLDQAALHHDAVEVELAHPLVEHPIEVVAVDPVPVTEDRELSDHIQVAAVHVIARGRRYREVDVHEQGDGVRRGRRQSVGLLDRRPQRAPAGAVVAEPVAGMCVDRVGPGVHHEIQSGPDGIGAGPTDAEHADRRGDGHRQAEHERSRELRS
jgi:hypothetical protein